MDEEKKLHEAVNSKRLDDLEAEVALLWKRLGGVCKELDALEDCPPASPKRWWRFWL